MDRARRQAAAAQPLHERVHAAFAVDGAELFTQDAPQVTPPRRAHAVTLARRLVDAAQELLLACTR
jgi:hypothetical protein